MTADTSLTGADHGHPVTRGCYAAVVAAAVVAHFGYLAYLPSGGFMALRWPRSLWLHVPVVAWGVAVVTWGLPCPLTEVENWARARAGLAALPAGGFIGRYVAGVLYPAGATRRAQMLAFCAAVISWAVLAVLGTRARQRRLPINDAAVPSN